MNKEIINFGKPEKEAKKHERKSVSLIDELKNNNENQEKEDILEEEIEARFWENLYESKLAEIKDNDGFQEETIDNLDQDIQAAQTGNGANALWVLTTLSYYKNLNIYEEEFQKTLEQIKTDDDFKKATINKLDKDIQGAKTGNGADAFRVLTTLSYYKSLNIYEEEFQERLDEVKTDEDCKKGFMHRLDSCIQNAQGGSDINAYFALTTFSVYKTLNIYQEEFQERLEEIKSDESFKKATIHKLNRHSQYIQNGNRGDAYWVFSALSFIKDLSQIYKKLAQEKQSNIARNENKNLNISKRPEIR